MRTKANHPNVIHRVTTSLETGEAELNVDFTSLVVKTDDILADSNTLYTTPTIMLTTGLQIAEDLVWVAIDEKRTKWNYDTSRQHQTPVLTSSIPSPWNMERGESVLANYEIRFGDRIFGDLLLTVDSVSTQDAYYIGKPMVKFHGRHTINNINLLAKRKLSPSGRLGHSGWTMTFDDFLFYQGCPECYGSDDYIELEFPVTFLDYDI